MFRQPENKLSISGGVKRAVQGGVNERRSSLARLLFCAARACTFHGRAIFLMMILKNGFGKYSLFVLSANGKKTLIWRRHCSIGQSCCSMASKQSID